MSLLLLFAPVLEQTVTVTGIASGESFGAHFVNVGWNAQVAQSTPTIWYRFESDSTDSSGNNRDVTTDPTTPAYVDAFVGKGNDFDGVDAFDHQNAGGYMNPDELSVELVFKYTGTGAQILAANDNGSGSLRPWIIAVTASGDFQAFGNNQFGPIRTTTATLDDGLWHHVVFTHNWTTGLTQHFIDNVKTTYPSSSTAKQTNDVITVGSIETGVQVWEGVIDEFVFYGSVLSDAEISAHFAELPFILPTGIVSGESFGTASINDQDISPIGIPSRESFGSAGGSGGSIGEGELGVGQLGGDSSSEGGITITVFLLPTGIASSEAFGTLVADPSGDQDLTPTGFVSGESFGTALVTLFVTPTGIASGEAFGGSSLAVSVAPTGIGSSESFGTGLITLFISEFVFSVVSGGGETTGLTDTLTFAPAAFTPRPDSLVLAFAASEHADSGVADFEAADTTSVPALSWTLVEEIDQLEAKVFAGTSGFRTACILARAPAGASPASTVVTFDFDISGGVDTFLHSGGLLDIHGHDSLNPFVQSIAAGVTEGGGGSESATLTFASTPISGNLVVAFMGVGADGAGGITAPTIGGETMTLVNDSTGASCHHAIYYRVITGAESTDTVTWSDLGELVGNSAGALIEIQAASFAIASSEAFGVAVVALADQNVTVDTGIVSSEAFGTSLITLFATPAGIASSEAFGTGLVTLFVTPTGIVSAEAFGTTSAVIEQFITPTGIVTSEAFGTALVTLFVAPTGIATSEAFGTALIEADLQTVAPTGIGSGESFGTALITEFVTPTGIASSESFGTGLITLFVTPTGIASNEAFGTAQLENVLQFVTPTGLTSGEAFGTALITEFITPTGIATSEAFGTALITEFIDVTGITSGESLGTPLVDLSIAGGPGIASSEAFGTGLITLFVTPTGIAGNEAFGGASIAVPQIVDPTGLVSNEAFGTPIVDLFIAGAGTGISSSESFGTALITEFINPTGIATGELLGTVAIFESITGCDVQTIAIFAKEQVVGTVTIEQLLDAISKENEIQLISKEQEAENCEGLRVNVIP